MALFKILLIGLVVLIATETRAQIRVESDFINGLQDPTDRAVYECLLKEAENQVKPEYCKDWQNLMDQELIQKLQGTTIQKAYPCFDRDFISRNAQDTLTKLVNILYELDGLPPKIRRKIRKLLHEEARVYIIKTPLCLSNEECTKDSELVAKNYRFEKTKKGFIFINKDKWLSISASAKSAIMLHELLSVLGFETNSYEISSILQIEEICDVEQKEMSFTQVCWDRIKTLDNTTIPLKVKK